MIQRGGLCFSSEQALAPRSATQSDLRALCGLHHKPVLDFNLKSGYSLNRFVVQTSLNPLSRKEDPTHDRSRSGALCDRQLP